MYVLCTSSPKWFAWDNCLVSLSSSKSQYYFTGNSAKSSPKDENKSLVEENVEQQANSKNISASASAFFTSAWNKVGTFSSNTNESTKSPEGVEENVAETENEEGQTTEEKQGQKYFFSNFSNMVGKVANNATTAIKDKVGNVGMIGEFNKQQEDFIKNKGKYFLFHDFHIFWIITRDFQTFR